MAQTEKLAAKIQLDLREAGENEVLAAKIQLVFLDKLKFRGFGMLFYILAVYLQLDQYKVGVKPNETVLLHLHIARV